MDYPILQDIIILLASSVAVEFNDRRSTLKEVE
jgi:hypothetical protein